MKKSVKERVLYALEVYGGEIVKITKRFVLNEDTTEELEQNVRKEKTNIFSTITKILKDMECMEKAEIKKEHKTSPIVEATLDAYNQHIDEFWKEWEGKDK